LRAPTTILNPFNLFLGSDILCVYILTLGMTASDLFLSSARASISNLDFAQTMYKLTVSGKDQQYIPAQTELLWRAAELKENRVYKQIRGQLLGLLKKLASNQTHFTTTTTSYSLFELWHVYLAVTYVLREDCAFFERALLTILQTKLETKIATYQSGVSSPESQFLYPVETFTKNKDFAREYQKVPPGAWLIHTSRQKSISSHQDTRCIVVRTMGHEEETYQACDGAHESVSSYGADILPNLHDLTLTFARQNNYALGRVALVEMDPWSMSYRHFDSEIYLRGRKRFHFVVSAGEQNFLSCGDVIARVAPGELWFFENHVMHMAYNYCSTPRAHLIFDCYPLAK